MKDGKARRGGWRTTEEARAAAKRASELRVPRDVTEPTLFILRMPHPSRLLAWEVRKYSFLVLARGEGYLTEALARAAGERALIAIGAPPPLAGGAPAPE